MSCSNNTLSYSCSKLITNVNICLQFFPAMRFFHSFGLWALIKSLYIFKCSIIRKDQKDELTTIKFNKYSLNSSQPFSLAISLLIKCLSNYIFCGYGGGIFRVIAVSVPELVDRALQLKYILCLHAHKFRK